MARRTQGGVATADVVVSARVGDNAELFAQILALHVPTGSLVADVTFGLGAFWKKVPAGAYRVLASDLALKPEVRAPEGFALQSGVDCRALPHKDASLDALVLDPPYMEGLYRRDVGHLAGSGSHAAFRRAYSQSAATEVDDDGEGRIAVEITSGGPEVRLIAPPAYVADLSKRHTNHLPLKV